MGGVQGPSALPSAQLLRSDLVELLPWQFSLWLRDRGDLATRYLSEMTVY